MWNDHSMQLCSTLYFRRLTLHLGIFVILYIPVTVWGLVLNFMCYILIVIKQLYWQVSRLRNQHKINVYGTDLPEPLKYFDELTTNYKLESVILENITDIGYTEPTPIQRQAIPAMLHVSFGYMQNLPPCKDTQYPSILNVRKFCYVESSPCMKHCRYQQNRNNPSFFSWF